ncbi:hypothetical protein [Streptomyces sp. NPDC001933]|uniref:hypothetical protein n=1 Tax=Streptomyces sp. NPDC001933 TaxID=3364626 RepID=UPI00368B5CF2
MTGTAAQLHRMRDLAVQIRHERDPGALHTLVLAWARGHGIAPALGLHRLPVRVVQEEVPLQIRPRGSAQGKLVRTNI